ncbi:uncharacterized protein JCM15063_001650 [Sporobolomyces koalae]|uniref:uncharacterized protein n=1 Tax=Sporobolomyces koalae TaxID=500713 RepID=UPI00317431E5
MNSPSTSSSSESGSELSTRPTTATSSPKLGSEAGENPDVGLPSPFYPPSLAHLEGLHPEHEAPRLPEFYPRLPPSVRTNDLQETDAQSKSTPDEWVIRDPALVRLTGKWPFNSEPPLPDLWQEGFLTPTRLFYVRNHGVVPRVTRQEAERWSFEISGLVENPCTLTLADLIDPSKFRTVTLPVTLVCAGNRRKEQNVVKKSLGFSWGPAGLSTALFTGVYLADVLEYARPRSVGKVGQVGFRRAEHVIFEGAEDLPNGKYGTSQRLRWARLREKGMLLAWAMNGEALEPDHGFPLRLVVPGQIGGRSVKWLKKIEVSDEESQHHLHFWDNKVLPTTLSAEQARSERDWWYDPRYIINDLNVNSAIAKPAHNEQLVASANALAVETYKVEGYVYAGGGRRVTRVEVTLDDGETWTLATMRYPEDQYRAMPFESRVWGTIDLTDRDECFCWAFWSLDVPVARLVHSGSIAVRGMDESLSSQPSTMYWNPTGMMNNWWFRVAIHKSLDSAGQTILKFEHPTMPGLQTGGWMERLKDSGVDPLKPTFKESSVADTDQASRNPPAPTKQLVMTKPGVDRKITMQEVREQGATEETPWFIVHGQVYDGAGFLKDHPGGSESITLVAGEDATEDFMAIHSIDAKLRLADFHIGTLVQDENLCEPEVKAPSEPDPVYLSKSRWKAAELVSIDRVNHDSRLYRFALEHPDQPLGLPIGQHVYCRLRRKRVRGPASTDGCEEGEGELVQRAYTPVSLSDAKGFIDLLVKVYFPTTAFPEGGKMTIGFEELQVGDKIEFKGPLGSFEWLGGGVARWRGIERRPKQIGMICGGSGITPILQVLRGVIHDPTDRDTKLFLLNANKTEADILLRTELDSLVELAGEHRYQQHFVLSQASQDWAHSHGRIDRDLLHRHLPPVGDKDDLVLICGPDPMIKMVKQELASLGWDIPTQLVIF